MEYGLETRSLLCLLNSCTAFLATLKFNLVYMFVV